MESLDVLKNRVNAELDSVAQKIKEFREEQVRMQQDREKRLQQFVQVAEHVRDLVAPRIKVLLERFADMVEAKPVVRSYTREVLLEFKSSLARIRLRFSGSTDRDVKNLVLDYDLEIVPVLLKYEPHSRLEVPLDAVDDEAVVKWFDDRIVAFVQTYIQVLSNDYYLKDHMVEDPVAKIRFPKFIAQATLDWNGQKLYFIAEETRDAFAKENGIKV